MCTTVLGTVISLLAAVPAFAQEGAEGAQHAPSNLLSINGGLMFWTLVIFVVLMFVLAKFAFKPITAAVEAREKALEDAIAAARRDREEAAALLAEHRKLVEQAHANAQQLIVEARSAGEKVRAEIVERAHQEQRQILERARAEIQGERDRAIVQLRREAVELAVRGASKVIEKNLDNDTNRRLVESFLATLTPAIQS
ncbi:MAG: F0F1 ATP synthase subunit B [Gemmatimonadaceae bacterium]|nr:F0F1 ATP synthase subunit B [Gemmatimonadaceae bacterium]